MSQLGEGWVMDSNHINFEEQVVALLTASHPRCGRDSAAGLLSYHTNQPLIRQIVGNKWRLGHVVIQLKTRNRGGSCGLSLAVGVSMSTLGVACTTETMRKYYVSGVAWIDSRHYLAHGPDPAVVSAECGARVVVPGMDKSTQMSLVCKGKWMVDHAVWKVWRVEVGVDGSGVDRMTVSQPRTVTQCFESGEGDWSFINFVGDRYVSVGSVLRRGTACGFHLVDIEKAFETGVMVPVDSVTAICRPNLPPTKFYCFWGSKRVVAEVDHALLELSVTSYSPRIISRKISRYLVMEDFLILRRGPDTSNQLEVWNFSRDCDEYCDPRKLTFPVHNGHRPMAEPEQAGPFLIIVEGLQVHLVDPTSGLFLFTLSPDQCYLPPLNGSFLH